VEGVREWSANYPHCCWMWVDDSSSPEPSRHYPDVKAECHLGSPPSALVLREGGHLALPPVQREGACGVFYQVVQMWGRRERWD